MERRRSHSPRYLQVESRTTARTRQTMGSPLPPCPAFLFSNRPSRRCQVRIDRLQTASTNGRPPGAAGLATQIATQQHTRWCQRHPNVAHPTATPQRRQEEGGLRSSVGDGGGGVRDSAPQAASVESCKSDGGKKKVTASTISRK